MKNVKLERRHLETDVLIIGGTAGCYAAIKLGAQKDLRVLVVEKANIERSGCLAAGVNALNAYISNGHTPADYVEYARRDAEGIIRDDLMMTIAESVNGVTEDLEHRGLVILKDEAGNYVTRGWRNVKINGENIKPLLAKGVRNQSNVTVLNHVNITDLKVADGTVHGAWGFSVRERAAYDIEAKAVLIVTGGAAGLYRLNNPGFSRHKMWYPPFNTGAGYAMGIRAGAEMTTLEHRFVALRCKDTIAPTGTIAQGGRRQAGQRQGGDLRDEVRAHDAPAHFRHGRGEPQGHGTLLPRHAPHHGGTAGCPLSRLSQHGTGPDAQVDRERQGAEGAACRGRGDRAVYGRRSYGQRLLGRDESRDDRPRSVRCRRYRWRRTAEIRDGRAG